MLEKNIDLLCEEGLRLLEVQVDCLRKMQDQQGVVVEAFEGEGQTFDKTSLPKYIEILEGEKTKLQNLEMVLAVVGTMKAGKSTTINAIVGTEVLPNRNRPMTALPTLIRHTPGQIDPVLKFANNKPINKLMRELHSVLTNPRAKVSLGGLSDNPDMAELLTLISNKATFKTEYFGPEKIFWFLKSLNDLVRLSQEVGVDFPFQDYDKVHEMPVIEVEFAHLRHINASKGRLTLLDTPGPNEAGQPHLRKMLKEQLGKASAVLAIMDYTQLKSDADAEVRRELQEIASVAKGRLYALVNKFDQKDRNGDGIEEVKSYVATSLMEGAFRKEDVFPASSKWAYLANRALHEMHLHNRLPDPDKQAWVADFGEEAMGRRWNSKIGDPEEVRDAAKGLWKDSLFSQPIENVIRTAHARAAAYAIDSAAAKLIDIADKLNNFLGLRESALSKNASELKKQITSLMKDADSVENAEQQAITKANDMLSNIDSQSKKIFDGTKVKVKESLEDYFREGKKMEEDQFWEKMGHRNASRGHKKKESSVEDKKSSGSSRGLFLPWPSRFGNSIEQEEVDFDPLSKILKFDDKKKAKDLVERIKRTVETAAKAGETTLIESVQDLQTTFREDFSKSIDSMVTTIAKTIKERMDEDDFRISLAPPATRFPSLDISSSDLLDSMVKEKTKTVTRQRRKEGAWGTVCRWFKTDDLGWESYEGTEDYFEVDMPKIKESVLNGIDQVFGNFQTSIAESIQKPLTEDVESYFSGFKLKIENIRGDLQQGIRDQESSKDEKEALAKRIAQLRKGVPGMLKDGRELSEDVKPLLRMNDEVFA